MIKIDLFNRRRAFLIAEEARCVTMETGVFVRPGQVVAETEVDYLNKDRNKIPVKTTYYEVGSPYKIDPVTKRACVHLRTIISKRGAHSDITLSDVLIVPEPSQLILRDGFRTVTDSEFAQLDDLAKSKKIIVSYEHRPPLLK